MEIIVRLAGVELGPYSETKVRQYLEEGLVSLTDVAKEAGTEEWIPVSEILAKLPPPTDPPAPESKPDAAPDAVKRAPDLPPTVPVFPPKQDDKRKTSRPSLVSLVSQRTAPLPSAAPAFRTTAVPTPPSSLPRVVIPPKMEETKKVSRLIQVRTLAQNTTPLPTAAVPTPRAPAHPSFPTAPASGDGSPGSPATEKMTITALAKALAKKTVPMRSAPPLPTPSTAPASTTPMPRTASPKPPSGTLPPPSEAKHLTKKLGRLTPGEANAQTSPPTLGLTVGPDEPAPPAKTPVEGTPTLPETKPLPPPAPARPRRIFPVLIGAWAVLAALMVYYVWSPYHAASSLRSALQAGDQDQLEREIDFPSVQASLKDQIQSQIAQSGLPDDKTNPAAAEASAALLSMMDNSIDLYVTPGGISTLVKDPGAFAKPGASSPIILAEMAAKILDQFYSLPVNGQGLASPGDFVIDNDVALLHLRFNGLGWTLRRIDLRPDLSMPALSALSGSSNATTPPLFSPVVDTYLQQAAAKQQVGDWDGAIADFTQVLAINPQSSVVYNDRASARQSKGELDAAITDYTRALELDPNLTAAYQGRGDARSANGDPGAANSDYSQALERDPSLTGIYYKRANARTAIHNWEGAISDYTAALKLNPNQAKAFSNRGFARQATGNLDGAIADYTQALALDPKDAVTYYNRGFAQETQGGLDAAISDFDRAVKLDPKLALAYYERGNIEDARNDADGAVADFTQAVALKPELAPAYNKRGLDRQAKGDLDGALADYNRALSLDPKIATAYSQRALIKQQKNDLDGAIADNSQALDLDPKNAQACYHRGFAKLAKGNLDGAMADLKQFCDLAPKDASTDDARLYLWLIGKAQNPKDGADQDLADALQNNWNSDPNDLAAKTAAFLLGHIKEAEFLASAASTDPTKDPGQHCKAWYFAGMKRLLAGDKKNAVEDFRKCVATGQTDRGEYILAQAELQSLESVTPPPVPSVWPATNAAPTATAPAPAPAPAPAKKP